MSKRKEKGASIDHGIHHVAKDYGCLVLRPNVPFEMITKFNLFMALGIRDTMQQFSNEKVTIKWPNDIYIDGKKLVDF